jgi:hypothetical protein
MYGAEAGRFKALWEAQGGACAICGEERPMTGARRPDVDHDHTTGQIRGLLCNPCNVGIAHFKDDPERLERAGRYLGRSTNGDRYRFDRNFKR